MIFRKMAKQIISSLPEQRNVPDTYTGGANRFSLQN
jgi:hypothetical protein